MNNYSAQCYLVAGRRKWQKGLILQALLTTNDSLVVPNKSP